MTSIYRSRLFMAPLLAAAVSLYGCGDDDDDGSGSGAGNGPWFMADFEAECAQRRIALFVLPPRSPKLNGHVERANGTHTAEFWEVTDAEPEYEPLREAMLAWETCYNTIRPHQALGYLTPAEWLARHGIPTPQV